MRKREAAILCPVRIHSSKTVSSLSRRVNVNFPATGTSLQGVDTKENANDSSADAPDQVEQLFNATAVNTKNEATQVDVHSAVTIVERQKWRRRYHDLKTQIELAVADCRQIQGGAETTEGGLPFDCFCQRNGSCKR